MTNMENLQPELDHQAELDRKYEAAMRSIAQKDLKQEARGYAVMSAFQGYGESALGDGPFARVSHAAKLFCIAFAGLAPCYLIWSLLL
ncbi:MAG: hypothetical protein AAFY74_08715 [Pseudomonadota bacterium]